MIPLLLTLLASTPGATPDAWPGFLGAGATPVDPQTLPLTWSATKNIAWKTALPAQGQSSPVIWGDKVFVTCIEGAMKDTCHVVALALLDGRVLWDHKLPASQKVRSNYFQSRSAPTPVVDAERVYAFFETGNLLALTHDGKEVWSRSLTRDYGAFETRIGIAASPTQTRSTVVLLLDHEGPSYMLAVDKKTGQTLWKTERDSRHSYASPALVPVGKSQQIVCSSEGSVDGYDPATGKLLWSFDDIGGNNVGIPFSVGPGRFLVSARPGMHKEREKEAKRSNLLLTLEPGLGGSLVPSVAWRVPTMPSFANPVAHQGIAYWVNSVGLVSAFDVKTGTPLFAERIKQTCWAAPLGFGERVYFFGKDGATTVLKAGPEFKVLATNLLWETETTEPRPRGDGQDHQLKPDTTPANPKAGEKQPRDGDKPAPGKERPERGPGGKIFADPIQYGVAVVNGSLVIRSGAVVYCVRQK